MIHMILRLIVGSATPSYGSETQSLAMAEGAQLESMFTPAPLWACCFLSCLTVVHFLFFFQSTTVKSAPSYSTASADCGRSALLHSTLAKVRDEGGGGREEVRVEWAKHRAVTRQIRGRRWSRGMGGFAGVGGAAVWGGGVRG